METVRRCQIKLLDDRKIELSINAKQTVSEMTDEIARQYNLTETEYFGLYYEENTSKDLFLIIPKKLSVILGNSKT
ncbi:unnamed protein product [Didymodactylos carnosus]|uniref:FERM domain-containing protein n=2 Tax=Didymodactylos carnosus TaxID=1234261 RepID=A0A814TFE7_9BILA|nr:unnamed protein product [Didymodactylos carnosus]CAF3922261.1 unnamed protein product [Didymodactylos carnosus]